MIRAEVFLGGWSTGSIIPKTMKSESLGMSYFILTGIESSPMVFLKSRGLLYSRFLKTLVVVENFQVDYEVVMVNVEVVVVNLFETPLTVSVYQEKCYSSMYSKMDEEE